MKLEFPERLSIWHVLTWLGGALSTVAVLVFFVTETYAKKTEIEEIKGMILMLSEQIHEVKNILIQKNN
jgi:hypothetical protein